MSLDCADPLISFYVSQFMAPTKQTQGFSNEYEALINSSLC